MAVQSQAAAPVARTAVTEDDMAHHTASHPSVVEIPMAKVIRGTARYIVKVSTVDGRQWAVAKRFSEFFDLKTEVSCWIHIPGLTLLLNMHRCALRFSRSCKG